MTRTRPGRSDAGQLLLPLVQPGTAKSADAAIMLGTRAVTVRFVRHPRARRYVLRVAADGSVRVTVPRGGTREEALAFVRRQAPWIERQRYAAARAQGALWVRGELRMLEVRQDAAGRVVWLGGDAIEMRRGESARTAACRHLRGVARRELGPRLRELAALHGVPVAGVAIRSQRTRWGSCSPRGVISLNWRLVQMPDDVRDYVLIHEVMHVREANHSRRFWHQVEHACPGHREARRWLKAHGEELL